MNWCIQFQENPKWFVPSFVVSTLSRSRTATGIDIGLFRWALRFLKHPQNLESNTRKKERIWLQLFQLDQLNREYLLDELVGGVLDLKTDRFFCLISCSGVSSTTRLAIKRLSSSQPAMAAADLNLGLNIKLLPPLSISTGFASLGWVLGLCLGSSWALMRCFGSEKVKGFALWRK